MQTRSAILTCVAIILLITGCQSAQAQSTPIQATVPDAPQAEPTSSAEPETYLLHGISRMTLDTALPASPSSASVFLASEAPLTLEVAQELAARFGMQGPAYQDPVQGNFIFANGNRRLDVGSSSSFTYFPTAMNYWTAVERPEQADAEALITEFLDEFGFEGEHEIVYSEPHNGYFALPLTEDGVPIRRDHFWGSGLLFTFSEGEIASVWADLLTYETVGTYDLISAEEAFQKLLAPYWYGTLDAGTSGAWPEGAWARSYPLNETVEVYGSLGSIPAFDGGQPLLTLDGYPLVGTTETVPSAPHTYAKAIGHFEIQDGTQVFVLESWTPHTYDGYVGTLQEQGDDVILVTDNGEELRMPDVPADVPLPLETVYVVGAVVGDTLEWNAFDLRMANGGGGGGGGGMGFFQLDLTGSGQALPATPTPEPTLADQVYEVPTATIETVELVYFIPAFYRLTGSEPLYVQPMWRFAGHWSTGDVFEIVVQALDPKFLSPTIQVIEPPG